MKANDFLKLINTTIKAELPEEILSKLDIDLPENFETQFANSYLTRDRAKNDDEVIAEITKKVNKTGFTNIDEQIKELLPFVSDSDRQKINSTFSTADKVKLLKPAIEAAMAASKGKLTDADIRKVDEEWQGKYKSLQEQHTQQLKDFQAQMEDKNFENFVISKMSGFPFTKEFSVMKDQINQLAVTSLKGKGYKYVQENGTYVVRQTKDGIDRDVFEPGTENKITIEKLIDSLASPFVAKSNGGGEGGNGSGNGSAKILTPVTGKESLHELMLKNEKVI